MRRHTTAPAFLLAVLLTPVAQAQTITTVAGGGPADGSAATTVALGNPAGLADDGAGGFYVTAQNPNQIFHVAASGALTVFAGQLAPGFGGDGGPARAALLKVPFALARDAAGNLYVSEVGSLRVRRIDPAGIITTVAGNGTSGSGGDGGLATAAQLQDPRGLAVDSAGNLYIADFAAHRVRQVSPSGIVTTVAGTGTAGYNGDGIAATSAQLNGPWGLAVDAAGNLYVSDFNNYRVRRVDAVGTITTYAGTGTAAGSSSPESGTATSLPIRWPMGLALDGSGSLYICDAVSRVLRVDPAGNLSRVAGNRTRTYTGDGGPATSAGISDPVAVAVQSTGGFVLIDAFQHVRRVDSAAVISTAAGNGKQIESGVGGPAIAAQVALTSVVAVEPGGALLFSDRGHVFRVAASGALEAFAGQPGLEGAGFSGDGGPASSAALSDVEDIAFDAAGATYLADMHRIRKVDASGIITTIAGTGVAGFNGDGLPASLTQLNYVVGLAVDSAGNVLFSDTANHRIRRIDVATGLVTTIAGTGVAGFAGDGGPATSARINAPKGLVLSTSGDLYFSDGSNSRVRRVRTDGTIQSVASVPFPLGLDIDASGRIYVATGQGGQSTVRRVGTDGRVTIVAGTGVFGFGGDGGPALAAALANPIGVRVAANGDYYIADFFNRRIRKVTINQPPVANAGPDQLLEATGVATPVSLDGSASLDPDGSPLSYTWRDDAGVVVGTAVSITVNPGLGSHTFSLTVSDGGASSVDNVTVMLRDTRAPILVTPSDITVAATTAAGAVVAFSVTATDVVDPSPAVSCAPASGSILPIGATLVMCTATDAAGNSSSGSFHVTVVDLAPPVLTLPGNIMTPSTGPSGAVVTFGVSATDAIDPSPVVACSAASGATFPIGQTTVTCTAADFAGNVSRGSFTVGVTVSSASVTIKGSSLRESPSTIYWTLTGPSTALALWDDATRMLVPGTYQVSVYGGQPLGTFTVDAFGRVLTATGALTTSGSIVDFDLSRLAKVTIAVEHLSTDPAKAYALFDIAGITNVHRRTSPVFYLPPNLPGKTYLLRTRGTTGTYGTFVVNPDLTLGTTTGSLLVSIGPGGPQIDFDLTALTGIGVANTADLTEPYGVGAFWHDIADVVRVPTYFGGATAFLPANNSATASYIVSTYGTGAGRFGTFRVESDGSVSAVTGALVLTELSPRLWQMAFDRTKLARIDLRIQPLVQPYQPFRFGLVNEVVWVQDQTVYLPPNSPGGQYQFYPDRASSVLPSPNFGTLRVASDLSLTTSGAMRIGTDGHALSPNLCALNGIRIAVAPGRTWYLGAGYGYYARDISPAGNATDVFLPDGTYTITFYGNTTITVTLAAGTITSASPGLSVVGGSVSSVSCDSTPPVLSLPADFTVAATSAAGAVVDYIATATDAIDSTPTLTCAPVTGSIFALGTHAVSCTATDDNGNSASGSFHVTVADQTPPVLVLPGPINLEATGPLGGVVTWSAGATDAIDPAPVVSCVPSSGSTFSLGTTTVACTATDATGNASSGAFSVTVVDATAPVLTVPSDITVETGNPAGAAVTFSVTATDAIDPAPVVSCAPASGATFPVGATSIACSAHDASGNASTGGFRVSVVSCPIPTLALDPGNLLPVYTNQAARTVAGSIAGGACIASVELIVTGGGGTQTVPIPFAGDGVLSGDITLTTGSNDVVLKVTDRVGRTFASGARTLVLDEMAPQLQVLSPAENSATGSSTLSLSFSISDSSPTSVTVSGQTFSFTGASNVQSATVTLDHEGPQTIGLVARDAAGNESSSHLSVLLDPGAPLASIDLADGARFGPLLGDSLPFTLVVDALSATTIATSYGTTHALPRGGGIIHGVVPLAQGVSTATFTVESEIGRVTSLSRTVTYDKTPPAGDLTSPGPGDFVRGTLHLSADVIDALTGVAGVTFQVDGLPPLAGASGMGDAWIASFNTTTVSDGPHSVQVTFTDGVANTTSVTMPFVVDNTPPLVSLIAPGVGSYLHGAISIVANATDATSGVSLIDITVNGASVGTCPNSPCSVAFDTRTLGADGAFTVVATARDGAGNNSMPAQVTAIADNSAPSNFLVRPTNGQILTTSMLVSMNVVDSAFARVECFVDGVSLGASTNPQFTQTVSLLDKMDGTIEVACRAEDLAGNATVQTVVPTIRNWSLRMRPNQLNLKSRGKDVRMTVRNLSHSVTNASLLLSKLSTLFLVLPGGVAPIPIASARPPGDRDDDDDGDTDDDVDDEPRGRVLLKFSRAAFVAGVKSGIAIGAIDPRKPVVVTLLSGAHVIGTDTIRVNP